MTSPTSAAEQQRRYRKRQRRGVCVVPVEIDGDLLNALVTQGGRSEKIQWDPKELGRRFQQVARGALGRRGGQVH